MVGLPSAAAAAASPSVIAQTSTGLLAMNIQTILKGLNNNGMLSNLEVTPRSSGGTGANRIYTNLSKNLHIEESKRLG